MSLTLKQLASQIEGLQAQIEGLITVLNVDSKRISALEAELEHQKRINVLIQKGKYGPGTSQPSTPMRSMRDKARELAMQGHKVTLAGGQMFVDGQAYAG